MFGQALPDTTLHPLDAAHGKGTEWESQKFGKGIERESLLEFLQTVTHIGYGVYVAFRYPALALILSLHQPPLSMYFPFGPLALAL